VTAELLQIVRSFSANRAELAVAAAQIDEGLPDNMTDGNRSSAKT